VLDTCMQLLITENSCSLLCCLPRFRGTCTNPQSRSSDDPVTCLTDCSCLTHGASLCKPRRRRFLGRILKFGHCGGWERLLRHEC
jgi:hypothetical protein